MNRNDHTAVDAAIDADRVKRHAPRPLMAIPSPEALKAAEFLHRLADQQDAEADDTKDAVAAIVIHSKASILRSASRQIRAGQHLRMGGE